MRKSTGVTNSYWESFLSGNKEAFAHFYTLHVDALFHYGTKLCGDESTVKDAIQEIFLDLYLKRNNTTACPGNLRYYLMLALKRNLVKKMKRNRKHTQDSACRLHFEPEYSIEKVIIENEEEAALNRRIHQFLQELPAKQKEILYLRFNESMKYSEIAQMLNISVESAQKQVYRALKSIRKKFEYQGMVLFLMAQKKYA